MKIKLIFIFWIICSVYCCELKHKHKSKEITYIVRVDDSKDNPIIDYSGCFDLNHIWIKIFIDKNTPYSKGLADILSIKTDEKEVPLEIFMDKNGSFKSNADIWIEPWINESDLQNDHKERIYLLVDQQTKDKIKMLCRKVKFKNYCNKISRCKEASKCVIL